MFCVSNYMQTCNKVLANSSDICTHRLENVTVKTVFEKCAKSIEKKIYKNENLRKKSEVKFLHQKREVSLEALKMLGVLKTV